MFFYKCTFPASESFFSVCVACVYGLPMQIGKQGGGMDLFVYFKNVDNVVSIKLGTLFHQSEKVQ